MTTSNKTLKNFDSVKEYLNNLDDSELVSIHNEYCQSTNNPDGEIYNNDEDFFTTFFEGKVLEAVRAVSFVIVFSSNFLLFVIPGFSVIIIFGFVFVFVDVS